MWIMVAFTACDGVGDVGARVGLGLVIGVGEVNYNTVKL